MDHTSTKILVLQVLFLVLSDEIDFMFAKQDDAGQTPLFIASANGHMEAMLTLESCGECNPGSAE